MKTTFLQTIDPDCWGLNCVPPTKPVLVLNPDTCDCDRIWKQGLCRWNQDEVIRDEGSAPMTVDPTRRGENIQTRRKGTV